MIPSELKSVAQWILWKSEVREGKATKVPCDAQGKPVAVNDPESWWTYEAAAGQAEKHNLGIGFCFTKDDPYFGVDLDACWPNMSQEAREIAAKLKTYAEISPSGQGIKFIGRGAKGANLRAKTLKVPGLAALEVYDRDRFFTITGNAWGLESEIQECQDALDWIMDTWLPLPGAAKQSIERAPLAPAAEDQVVIDRMLGFANGEKARRLWEGDTSDYNHDTSSADLALVSMIAFACGGPYEDQIERIFGTSALGQRAKWQQRDDYRKRTIAKALDEATEFYTPPTDFGTDAEWRDDYGLPPEGSLSSWLSFKNLIDFDGKPPLEPEIAKLAYCGQRNLWSGHSESGKTWAAVYASVEEMKEGLEVLWIDTDGMGERATLERLKALGATNDQIENLFRYIVPSERPTRKVFEELTDMVKGRLVVIDSFNATLSVIGGDFNDGKNVEDFWQAFDVFTSDGRAVVVLDHVAKNAESRGAYSIGSERKHSGAFAHLRFNTIGQEFITREGVGRSNIGTNKDRGSFWPRPTAFTMRVVSGSGKSEVFLDDPGAQGEFRPTDRMKQVSDAIESEIAMGEKPPSQRRINEIIGGKESITRAAIKILEKERYIEKEKSGWKLIRPYHGDETFEDAPVENDGGWD